MGNKAAKTKVISEAVSDSRKSKLRVCIVLLVALVVFVACWLVGRAPLALYNSDRSDAKNVYFQHLRLALDANGALFLGIGLPEDYSYDGVGTQLYEYEYAVVSSVNSEDFFLDGDTQNIHIGSQELTLRIETGRYAGREFEVSNKLSKLFDKYSKVGTRLLVNIYTNFGSVGEDGSAYVSVSITNYNRVLVLALVLVLFAGVTVMVGGKTGLRSLIGLAFTIACIFLILIPLLLRGLSAIWLTVAVAIYAAIVCFVLLDGINRKTVSAIIGTILGFTLAAAFASVSGALVHIDGLQNATNETDTLVQALYQGRLIDIRGLFVAGIIIASLGAVMDVAMSISSAIAELHRVNPQMSSKELFRSGMNIGRDAVGTMTNTLILAFAGSALVDFLLININSWDLRAIVNNDFIVSELISGVSGSIGIILAVPATALISSLLAKDTPLFGKLKPGAKAKV